MSDPTPVAIRLTQIVHEARGATVSEEYCFTDARALDDAGVREAGDKLEHLTKHPVDAYVSEVAKTALAALTGTVEKTLDGQWQGSTLGRNTGDEC